MNWHGFYGTWKCFLFVSVVTWYVTQKYSSEYWHTLYWHRREKRHRHGVYECVCYCGCISNNTIFPIQCNTFDHYMDNRVWFESWPVWVLSSLCSSNGNTDIWGWVTSVFIYKSLLLRFTTELNKTFFLNVTGAVSLTTWEWQTVSSFLSPCCLSLSHSAFLFVSLSSCLSTYLCLSISPSPHVRLT